jgi:methyl-accepting chemotaxis protein
MIDVQQRSANQPKTAVDELNNSVSAFAESSTEATSAAGDASSAADNGQEVVNHTVQSIQELAANVRDTVEVIRKLEADSNQVGVVLDVIKGIAEQTNKQTNKLARSQRRNLNSKAGENKVVISQ